MPLTRVNTGDIALELGRVEGAEPMVSLWGSLESHTYPTSTQGQVCWSEDTLNVVQLGTGCVLGPGTPHLPSWNRRSRRGQ